jgi:hypothetical protein
MGLIHTRASKKRDRTQAKLNEEELRERKAEFSADKPAPMQPTVGLRVSRPTAVAPQRHDIPVRSSVYAGGGGGRESNPPAPQRSAHRF